MKCLSIQQPWAHAILIGDKPVENRTWYCDYVGKLLIHAGKKMDDDGVLTIQDYFPETYDLLKQYKPIPRGAILGAVEMTDCVRRHDSEWFFGPFGFVFKNPVLFVNPIPYRGQLGIFNVDYSTVKAEIELAEMANRL